MKRRPAQPSGSLPANLAIFTPPPNATVAELFAAWEEWDAQLDAWLDVHPEDQIVVTMARDAAPVPDAPWDPDAI